MSIEDVPTMADPTAGGSTEGLRDDLIEAVRHGLSEGSWWASADPAQIADALLAGPLARASAERARVEAENARLRHAVEGLAFLVDGAGGAATPTDKLLRLLADYLSGKGHLENLPGHARGLYARADLLQAAASIARAALRDPQPMPEAPDAP